VASFSGGRITVGDLEDTIARRETYARADLGTDRGLRDLLDRMLRFDLYAQEAGRRGYANDDEVVQAQRVAAVGLLRDAMAVTPEQITDDAVRAYHAAHRERFIQPERRRASRIFVADEQTARQLLRDAAGLSPAAFAELALQHGAGAGGGAGGSDLGFFDSRGATLLADKRSNVDSAVASAAFAISEVGQLTGAPVPGDGGFSVVMLTGIEARTERPAPRIFELTRGLVANAATDAALDELVDALHAKLKPVVRTGLVDLIRIEPTLLLDVPNGTSPAPSDPRVPPQLVMDGDMF